MFLETIPKIGQGLGEQVVADGTQQVSSFLSDPLVLGLGIGLIIVSILILVFMKKIILNSILGLAAWVVINFILHIELPLLPSIVVSIVFGLAGIGVLLVLKFIGVV